VKNRIPVFVLIFAAGLALGLLIGLSFDLHFASEGIGAGEDVVTAAATGTFSADDLRININTASIKELMLLPGVGEKTAEAIISYREANGRFGSAAELMAVPGIGPSLYADAERYICAE